MGNQVVAWNAEWTTSFEIGYVSVLGNNSVGQNFVLEIESACSRSQKVRKVQAGQLYESPVLRLSPEDWPVAIEELTNRKTGFQETIESVQSLVTVAGGTPQNVLDLY